MVDDAEDTEDTVNTVDADSVRRLIAHRVPELSADEIAAKLGESVWLDALKALGAVFDLIEERLGALESVTASIAAVEAHDHVEAEPHHPRRAAA